jgi:hypothetical protein
MTYQTGFSGMEEYEPVMVIWAHWTSASGPRVMKMPVLFMPPDIEGIEAAVAACSRLLTMLSCPLGAISVASHGWHP